MQISVFADSFQVIRKAFDLNFYEKMRSLVQSWLLLWHCKVALSVEKCRDM